MSGKQKRIFKEFNIIQDHIKETNKLREIQNEQPLALSASSASTQSPCTMIGENNLKVCENPSDISTRNESRV